MVWPYRFLSDQRNDLVAKIATSAPTIASNQRDNNHPRQQQSNGRYSAEYLMEPLMVELPDIDVIQTHAPRHRLVKVLAPSTARSATLSTDRQKTRGRNMCGGVCGQLSLPNSTERRGNWRGNHSRQQTCSAT
eukprot:1298032-Rhodomonas_salina.2